MPVVHLLKQPRGVARGDGVQYNIHYLLSLPPVVSLRGGRDIQYVRLALGSHRTDAPVGCSLEEVV